jgi:xylose isomerase
MDKQKLLKQFVKDLGMFLESYYSKNISEINFIDHETTSQLIIKGYNNSDVITIYTEDDEITISLDSKGEMHWHIDDYNEPCTMENIYKQSLDDILAFLNGEYMRCKFFKNIDNNEYCFMSTTIYTKNVSIKNILKENRKICKKSNIIKIKKWGKEEEAFKIHKILNYIYYKRIEREM